MILQNSNFSLQMLGHWYLDFLVPWYYLYTSFSWSFWRHVREIHHSKKEWPCNIIFWTKYVLTGVFVKLSIVRVGPTNINSDNFGSDNLMKTFVTPLLEFLLVSHKCAIYLLCWTISSISKHYKNCSSNI